SKKAAITGFFAGIRRAIALAFVKVIACFACSDLPGEPEQGYAAADASTEIGIQKGTSVGTRATFVEWESRPSTELQCLFQEAVEQPRRVEIIALAHRAVPATTIYHVIQPTWLHVVRPVWEDEESAFEKTMDPNTKGDFLETKYASTQMIEQEVGPKVIRGWIINLARVFGLNGGPGTSESKCLLLVCPPRYLSMYRRRNANRYCCGEYMQWSKGKCARQ
ncbi:hypothetical protein BDW02DRAFT_617417, partial [Decorospora gaudefroyi]